MKFLTTALLFLAYSANSQAAGLVEYTSGTATPTTIAGYTMTDFALTNTGSNTGTLTSTVASPISGSLIFKNSSNSLEPMKRELASNISWWNNGESFDYDIFLADVRLIKIYLPENTRAFSFNVGANVSSTSDNAWLTATESNGSGISTKKWFNVNQNNTPGFGIYADNSAGACSSSLTSVTIDPYFWGFGNFSINQDDCTKSVPEASSIYLFGLGMLGLLIMARRKV